MQRRRILSNTRTIANLCGHLHKLTKASAARKTTISRLWDTIQTLRKKALYDDLTGLPNRVLFNEHLEQTFKERKRNQSALFYIDLNGFKQVNDTLGHAVGDATLKKVAKILTDSIRPGDIVARLGGDEFAMIVKSKHNKRVADRLTEKFGFSGITVKVNKKSYKIRVGLSIGAVRIDNTMDTTEQLYKIGDRAMYRAKEICRSSKLINYKCWGAAVK